MKLTVKTLKGEMIELEVQPSQTILDLKTKIKNQKGFEIDSQKIVFKGKSTVNTDELQKIGVKEGDFLVVMTVVKKPENTKKVQEKVSEVSKQEQKQPTKQQNKPQTSLKTQAKPETGQKQQTVQNQSQINELMSMGFPRDQCTKALKAAWGNSERAVEFLLNGNIPEQSNDPLHQQGMSGGLGGEMGTALLAQLVNSPQFAQIKQIIRSNPAALEPIMGQLQQNSPQLYTLIASNPEAFQRLILDESPQIPQIPNQMPNQPPPGTILVTAEQQQAIQRLMALGFSKLECAQAYMACDKNEEMAANLLFDRLANGDIDMDMENQGNGNNQAGNNEDDDDNLFN